MLSLICWITSNAKTTCLRCQFNFLKYWFKTQMMLLKILIEVSVTSVLFFIFFNNLIFFFLLLVCHSSYILHVCTNCCRYHPCDDIFSYCIAIMSQWTLIWSRRLSKRNFSIQKSLKYVIKKISHDFRHYMIIINLFCFLSPRQGSSMKIKQLVG